MGRLGRSLADLIDTLRVLEAAKVDLYMDQQSARRWFSVDCPSVLTRR